MKVEEIHAIMAKLKIGSKVIYKEKSFVNSKVSIGYIRNIIKCIYPSEYHKELCNKCIGYIAINNRNTPDCKCAYGDESGYDFKILSIVEDFISEEEMKL